VPNPASIFARKTSWIEIEKARRTDRGQPSERVPDLLRYLLAIAIHMVDPRNSDLFTTPVSGKLTSVFNTNLADVPILTSSRAPRNT
jgi:hypothetical protein